MTPDPTPTCCQIGCGNPAEFTIYERGTDAEHRAADNFTHACTAHVGGLLGTVGMETTGMHWLVMPLDGKGPDPAPQPAGKTLAEKIRDLEFLNDIGMSFGQFIGHLKTWQRALEAAARLAEEAEPAPVRPDQEPCVLTEADAEVMRRVADPNDPTGKPTRPSRGLPAPVPGEGEPTRGRAEGCPCTYVAPCSPHCSCAHPVMSGGCRCCCRYGSRKQRQAMAEHLLRQREAAADVSRLTAALAKSEADKSYWEYRAKGFADQLKFNDEALDNASAALAAKDAEVQRIGIALDRIARSDYEPLGDSYTEAAAAIARDALAARPTPQGTRPDARREGETAL